MERQQQSLSDEKVTIKAVLECSQGCTPNSYDLLKEGILKVPNVTEAFVARKVAGDSTLGEFSIHIKASVNYDEKVKLGKSLQNFAAEITEDASVVGLVYVTKVRFAVPLRKKDSLE